MTVDAGWVRGRLHYLAARIPVELEDAQLNGPGDLEELASQLASLARIVKNGAKELRREYEVARLEAEARIEAKKLQPRRDNSVKLTPSRRKLNQA